MSNFARIISSDARFSHMLSLEIASIGVEVVDKFSDVEDGDICYVVVDLDSVNESVIREYARNYVLIGFSHEDAKDIEYKASMCEEFFRRPFLISELLSVFDSNILPERIQKRPITRERVKGISPMHLSVSEMDKSAVWGEMRIPLSENEYKVLTLLCDNRCEIVEREQIGAILGANDGNMGDVYICHLRRKIDNKLGLKLIYTIRGKGYMLKN